MIREFAFFSILIIVPYFVFALRSRDAQCEWMEQRCVLELKGMAILSVLWAHVGSTMNIQHIQYFASIGVAIFLICSGYGLQVSFEHYGLNGFWRKRMIRVYVPFILVEMIHLFVTNTISAESIWNILIGFGRFKDYRWYIGYVFICYIIFWLIKRIVAVKYEMSILWACFFCWYVIDSIWFTIPGMEFLRAWQMLSFPLGIYLAKNKENVRIIQKSNRELLKWEIACFAVAVFSIVGMLYVQTKGGPIIVSNGFALFNAVPMALLIILLFKTHGKLFHNNYLLFCGSISFELYLLHIWEMSFVLNWTCIRIVLYVVVLFLTAWLLHVVEKYSTRKMGKTH